MGKRQEARRQGQVAEERAEEWFLKRFPAAQCIAKNYATRAGEIDLIFEITTQRKTELIFVEVRSRSSTGWVDARSSVTRTKRQRLKRAIEEFLMGYVGSGTSMRVDLLLIEDEQWSHCEGICLID